MPQIVDRRRSTPTLQRLRAPPQKMGGTCSVVGEVKGKGNELFKAGKFADAIEAYTSAIDADPKYSTRILVISYFFLCGPANQRMNACNTLMSWKMSPPRLQRPHDLQQPKRGSNEASAAWLCHYGRTHLCRTCAHVAERLLSSRQCTCCCEKVWRGC